VPFYVWWAIPLIATLVAVGWLSWRSRERAIDPHDSVAARRRFEEALAEPPATRNRRRTGRPGEASTEATDGADAEGTPPPQGTTA
jgi:hypothetical protein